MSKMQSVSILLCGDSSIIPILLCGDSSILRSWYMSIDRMCQKHIH